MQVAPLDAEFSGIAIIDGLDVADRSLYEDSDKLTKVIQSIDASFVGPRYECENRKEYYQALADLTSRAAAGDLYLVHFECHGCPDGLQIGSDPATWQDQFQHLANLNGAMHGQLLLNLSACNGIYATTMAGLHATPIPFYAIIGPAKRIAMKCAPVITAAFYEAYLGSADGRLDVAIAQANTQLGLRVIMGIRAEAFATLHAQGYPFRPKAQDADVVQCRPDGTLFVP